MKKNYFFGAAALCGLLAFTSCGNDDDPILDGPGNEVATGEQVIVLDMQDTDVLSTKSRPLYSTDNRGSEDVTDVMLYIFKEETGTQKLIKTIHVDNWDNTCEEYKYGRKRTIKLEGKDKLEAGSTYTIYAVGQNETEVEGNPAPFKFQGAVTAPGQDNQWKNIPGLLLSKDVIDEGITHNFATTPGSGFPYLLTKAVSYKDNGDAFASRAVGEVFSGQSKPVTLEPKESVSWTVLLKRQVAGVLGYFSNIPADGNALVDGTTACWSTKLRLVASNRNDRLDMTIQLNKQNDDATEVGKENIVNGFQSEDLDKDAAFKGSTTNNAYTVYEINLEDWFTMGEKGWTDLIEDTEDGNKKYLGKTSGWKNPYEGTNAAVTVADGAVLAGEFVIPFDKDETLNTFELQLIGKKKGTDTSFDTSDSDEYILQTWSVKLDDASIDATLKDTEYHYSIYRNHLYQIGKRGGGDDPDKPGVDPDKPQPLDKSQELVIKINDQWEFIHDLEID
ncbi:hypothetical protein [Parabacteroides merdae]|uniref:hypothetical protein n=1 Tax=Parabacteroides merdae TaxID=46503 RepID=UPI0032C0901E